MSSHRFKCVVRVLVEAQTLWLNLRHPCRIDDSFFEVTCALFLQNYGQLGFAEYFIHSTEPLSCHHPHMESRPNFNYPKPHLLIFFVSRLVVRRSELTKTMPERTSHSLAVSTSCLTRSLWAQAPSQAACPTSTSEGYHQFCSFFSSSLLYSVQVSITIIARVNERARSLQLSVGAHRMACGSLWGYESPWNKLLFFPGLKLCTSQRTSINLPRWETWCWKRARPSISLRTCKPTKRRWTNTYSTKYVHTENTEQIYSSYKKE